MNSLNKSLAHTVRYLGFIVRQLAGSNTHLYQKYYSASRYSARKLPQILTGIFDPTENTVFNTDKTVGFGAVPFGTAENELRQLQGEPECVRVDTDTDHNLRTLFYKEDVGGYDTRESVCLLEGRFFYGCHNFSRGPLLGRRDVNVIRRSLVGKYLNGEAAQLAGTLERFRIVDGDGNTVVFNNGVNMTITYYSGDSELNGRLKTLYEQHLDDSTRRLQLRREALAGRF